MITKICVALLALCLVLFPLELHAAEPPSVVAYRGLLLHAPENTLANFRACLELRLGFEFDVEKTKVGHPPQLKMSADEHQCCLIEIPRNPD